MNQEFIIRIARPEDAKSLLEFYAKYVEETAITFEYTVPSVEEFEERMSNTLLKYPYLVAQWNGELAGYAYASAFKGRAAYDWAVETTIYVKQDCKGKQIGKKLYKKLEELLKKQNILNMNACIAYTEEEDKHLTNASSYFHEKMGFKTVGRFTKCGYKFNTWYDMIWMEKLIGEHFEEAEKVIPFSELNITSLL